MSMITTYADIVKLRDAGKLTSAEEALIAGCKAGKKAVLGDGTLPDVPSDDCQVRAGLLRYLITGGCDKCKLHDWGVQLAGAYVSGELDLSFASAKGMTELANCRFDTKVEALQARFEFLNLPGCHLPGLNAQGVKVTGCVFLCGGFTVVGEASLPGAEIGGQLNCIDGHFSNAGGVALNAAGVRVTGDVFLQDGFTAEGGVFLSGAEIGGQLNCIGGHFSNAGRVALNAQKLVADAWIWRGVAAVSGRISLAGAKIGDLVDDEASWDKVDDLWLNGFSYQHIHGPVGAGMRLRWVEKGAVSEDGFSPQPYEQLAKVLRNMGHVADARKVLFEKEKRLNRVRLGRIWGQGHRLLRWLNVPIFWVWDKLLRYVVGYGYRPLWSFLWLCALFVVAVVVFDRAYQAGDFAPSAAVILASDDWQALAEDSDVGNPAEEWASKTGKGRDYESFNRYAYAADVVIPIIPLGQEEAWAPSTTRGPWGYHAWWARWVLKVLGWIVTAFGAAAITGIIRKE